MLPYTLNRDDSAGRKDRRTLRRFLAAAGRSSRRTVLAAAALVLLASSGCYDGEAVVQEVRSAALRTRLAEVDLGTFRTTMPRDAAGNFATELELHIFGTVPRYRVPAIEQQLKTDEYRLRHEMLAAVRQSTPEELTEPNLSRLRKRMERVANGVLEKSPVKSVGFYDVRLYNR